MGDEDARSESAYDVRLAPAAKRDLARLPKQIQKRLASVIEGLRKNPRPAGVKLLRGPERVWRVRAGDYRVLYVVDDVARSVVVTHAGHRRDVYDRR
jgi:mRNA interferase RelE/StbE